MALQTEAAPSSNAACKVANMYTEGLARIIVVKGRDALLGSYSRRGAE